MTAPATPPPDHKPDLTGLDDGPWLPGRVPRKRPAPKADAMAVARSALAAGAESGGAVLCIERAGQEMDAHIEMARIERGKRSRRPPGQAMNPYPGLEEGEEPGGMPFGGQGN